MFMWLHANSSSKTKVHEHQAYVIKFVLGQMTHERSRREMVIGWIDHCSAMT